MEHARKYRAELDNDDHRRPRTDPGSGLDGLEKVLRLSLPSRDGDTEPGRERGAGLTARDVTQAMEMVHEAAQSIRAAEERAREGEARTQALLQRATEELKEMEGQIQAAEGRARVAETRAQEAESRAKEAENWLRQIFSTISEELPPRR